MQEVLPKQAPVAAETNRKRDDVEKCEKEIKKQTHSTWPWLPPPTHKTKQQQTKDPKADFCNKIQ